MQKYRLLTNVYAKPLDGGYVGLYNPFMNHEVLFITEDTYHILNKNDISPTDLSSDLFQTLTESKFLVPIDFDENVLIQKIANWYPSKPSIGLMYLILSEVCNYKCKYCFIEENITYGKKSQNVMSQNTLDKAIDFFIQVCDKKAPEHKVIIYGGEPLTNKEIFINAVKRLRREENAGKLNKVAITLITNGSLVDDQIAQICSEYKVHPAVSIDGYQDIHNKCRIDYSEKGTFKQSVSGYRLFKEHGVSAGISCTITSSNATKLEEVADYFIEELEPSSVGFNLLVDFVDAGNPEQVNVQTATENMIAAFKKFRNKGIYEDRIMRRLEPFIKKEIYMKDCGAYGNQVVIAPDGQVGPCHAFLGTRKFFQGNVNDNDEQDIENNSIFTYWSNRHPFSMPECSKCSMISLCGGGCAYNAFTDTGDIYTKDERICIHIKSLLDWIIEELWSTKRRNGN